MEFKEFVKNAIKDVISAVDEASAESSRKVRLINSNQNRTIEFDIAVTAEERDAKSGRGEIKVLSMADIGGRREHETKNSSVSRIAFGVLVSLDTKEEKQLAKIKEQQTIDSFIKS